MSSRKRKRKILDSLHDLGGVASELNIILSTGFSNTSVLQNLRVLQQQGLVECLEGEGEGLDRCWGLTQ